MKIAVVYNRDSQKVINLFGQPNREKYGLAAIQRILSALRKGGHRCIALEGDKDLVNRLEEFMPRVVDGERPGLVFNISYGIQGQARYTHVPGILEMVGVPYVGSGPLAHSLALDKVVTKMILVQNGIPTPEFAVLETRDTAVPELEYPVIVKPKHEAVSYGIQVCESTGEVRDAAEAIFENFGQAVLVERFIEGREINVGLLGNGPPEAFPPVQLSFGQGGPTVYSLEDKTGESGRDVELVCPAPIGEDVKERAWDMARRAFSAIGCHDCARVDMRLDDDGNLYVLEINSLPSLGPRGSYVRAAGEVGLDFAGLVNRLVEVASTRYFGTPTPPALTVRTTDPGKHVFGYLTRHRDRIEERLETWVGLTSRTDDPVGLQAATGEFGRSLESLGMRPMKEVSDERSLVAWESVAGCEGGILLVGHLDVPVGVSAPYQGFRREPEWLYGEGIGSSRASLVMVEYALRSLRSVRVLRRKKIGIAYYLDEGRDARYSSAGLRGLMSHAQNVMVLRPGNLGDRIVVARRGQRRYRLGVQGATLTPGKAGKRPEPLLWLSNRMEKISQLGSRKERLSVSVTDLSTEAFPMLLPHRLSATILVTFGDPASADRLESELRDILGNQDPKWKLTLLADRPPMRERKRNRTLVNALRRVAGEWRIPLKVESSVWPSVAGLAPSRTAVLCGMGPVAISLQTPQEAIQRVSLIQRTLLLTEYLLSRES
jgi:D-alanine-D-alanine ligase